MVCACSMALYGLVQCTSWWVTVEVLFWCQLSDFGRIIGSDQLWSHRSSDANVYVRLLLVILDSISNQGGIYHCTRNHRIHHNSLYRDMDNQQTHRQLQNQLDRNVFNDWLDGHPLRNPDIVTQPGRIIDCTDLLQDPFVWIQFQLNPIWDHFWCFVVPGLYGLWRIGSFFDGLLIFGALRWTLSNKVTGHIHYVIRLCSNTHGDNCLTHNKRARYATM
jgi:stearoyl-CoA desaturase (delta-9 desaturase)